MFFTNIENVLLCVISELLDASFESVDGDEDFPSPIIMNKDAVFLVMIDVDDPSSLTTTTEWLFSSAITLRIWGDKVGHRYQFSLMQQDPVPQARCWY